MANFLNQVGLKKVFNLLRTYLGGTFIPLSQKGRNNGVATLNAEGKVPAAQAQFALRGNLVAKDIDSTALQTGFYRIIGQQLGDKILGGEAANGVLIQYSDGYREQMLMVGRQAGAAAGEQVETYTRRYLPAASRWTEWSKGGDGSDDVFVANVIENGGFYTSTTTFQQIVEARAANKPICVILHKSLSEAIGSTGTVLFLTNINTNSSAQFSSIPFLENNLYRVRCISWSVEDLIQSITLTIYDSMSPSEAREGNSSNVRTIQPSMLKYAIDYHTSDLVNSGSYNSETKKIELKHGSTVLAEIDATDFIKDGMVDSVNIENGNLVISFNTDSGKEDISLALTDIFNPDNYYTKQQADDLLSGKANTDDIDALQQLVDGKQDVIQDLEEIRAGATAGATALQVESDPTVPEWAKQAQKPSYRTSELTNDGDGQSPFATEKQVAENIGPLQQQLEGKQDTIQDLDEIRAGAGLGKTALQVESDPTVPEWAKQSSKPTYTAQEVGALPSDTPLFSGDYNDLENKPTIPTVPTKVSAFDNDAGYLTEHQDISDLVNGGAYNSETKKIELKHDNTVLFEIDAAPFIVDGMVENVLIKNGHLNINFNTDSGKQMISIPLTDIFNPDNYYNKEQTDNLLSNKQDIIQDLAEIVSGAAAGATAVQPGDLQPYATEQWVGEQGFLKEHQDISGKVDKVPGKQLSTEDYTTEEKQKLEGLQNYDDTELAARVTANETAIAGKQDKISDLDSIREGASKGATALQEHQKMKTVNGESLVGEGNIDIHNGVFVVTFTETVVENTSKIIADKTVSQIAAAKDNNLLVVGLFIPAQVTTVGYYQTFLLAECRLGSALGDIAWFSRTAGKSSDVITYITTVSNTNIGIEHFVLAERDSPNFIGTPTAPTAPVGTDTTQIATTAFVKAVTDNFYTKDEVDNLIPDVSGKADVSEVYTKTDVDNLIADVMASIPSMFIIKLKLKPNSSGYIADKTNQEINDAYYGSKNIILFLNSKIFTMKNPPGGGDAQFISTDPTDNTMITVTTGDTVNIERY